MLIEVLIGSIILAVGILLAAYAVWVLVIIGFAACFILLSYMIGAVVRECMPGYRGR
jgi:hypothetical protein